MKPGIHPCREFTDQAPTTDGRSILGLVTSQGDAVRSFVGLEVLDYRRTSVSSERSRMSLNRQLITAFGVTTGRARRLS
ncbi:MAG: hypothetical protein QOJ61_3666 [Mycobacterium sp.]|jgi:hypothetical protein|nr:hypothetical protein [Mycobacterium sp.]